jgi:hypothetical protein
LRAPYRIAAIIAVLAGSEAVARSGVILDLLVFVMCLDLLATRFARYILRDFAIIVLQVIDAVL